MAHLIADRVKQTSTSTGTGSFVLDGSVTGYQNFRDRLAVGDTTNYCITDGVDWEVGRAEVIALGTYPECTIARSKIIASSNADDLVAFGGGTKEVFITAPARKITARGISIALASGVSAIS